MKKLAIIFLLAAVAAEAQDLSTEVVVDRTVAVDLPKAMPMGDVNAELVLPHGAGGRLQSVDYTVTGEYAPMVLQSRPLVFTGIAEPSKYRGYAWLGYFPAYNLGGGAGYRLLDSKSDCLGVAAAFDGASWHGPKWKDVKPTQRYNTIDLLADYRHSFNNGAVVYGNVLYGHDGLKLPFGNMSSDKDSPQSFDRFAVEGGVSRQGSVSYSGNIFYRSFNVGKDVYIESQPGGVPTDGMHPGASDKHFGVKGHVGAEFGETSEIRMAVDAQYLDSKGYEMYVDRFEAVKRGEWLVDLNPTFSFRAGALGVRLGIHVDMSTPHSEFKLRVAPDAGLVWHVGKRVEVYADFNGGQRFNTLYDQYNYSVFAPGVGIYGTSWTKIDAVGGLRLGSFGGFSADLHAGYSDTDDAVMTGITSSNMFRTGLLTIPGGVSGWRFGGKLVYRYGDKVSVSAGGDVYSHDLYKGYYLVRDNARATFDAEVAVKVNEAINVAASYSLRAGRYAYFVYPTMTYKYGLGNMSDLGLRCNYRLNEQMSVFVRADNLLCRRYLVLPGVQSRRLHGLVGVSYVF